MTYGPDLFICSNPECKFTTINNCILKCPICGNELLKEML